MRRKRHLAHLGLGQSRFHQAEKSEKTPDHFDFAHPLFGQRSTLKVPMKLIKIKKRASNLPKFNGTVPDRKSVV